MLTFLNRQAAFLESSTTSSSLEARESSVVLCTQSTHHLALAGHRNHYQGRKMITRSINLLHEKLVEFNAEYEPPVG